MKPYLVITGSLFAIMTILHVWRAAAEWPQSGVNLLFVGGMTALILLPGILSWWAWRLLLRLNRRKNESTS